MTAQGARDYAAWYAAWTWWWVKAALRDLWDDLPGPRWVKVVLMAILVAGLLMPGQLDDIVIISALKLVIYVSKRHSARRA